MQEIYLKTSNLSHSYDRLLFLDINLVLCAKSSISIIGESGCGKSTLLHNLSTFLKPTNGIVELFSQDIYKLKTKALNNIRRHDISPIFQQHYLFRGFSLLENLTVSSIISNMDIDKNMLELFSLNKLLDKNIGDISGGEQQRLSILRALIKKPKIIFADEPTGNLDVKTRDIVMNSIFNYIEDYNSSMIMVTHDKELAFMSDEVYEIQDKSLIKLK